MKDQVAKSQLDRIVAEQIMGIVVLGECMVGTGDEGEEFVRHDANPEQWMCRMELRPVYLEHCLCEREVNRPVFGHTDICLAGVPRYTDDLNCAMQVVERMRDLGYECVMGSNKRSPLWDVEFNDFDMEQPKKQSTSAAHDQLAIAIVEGAIQAMELNVGKGAGT